MRLVAVRRVLLAVGTVGLVAGGCAGAAPPVSVPRGPPPPVRTAWEVPTPKGLTREPTTPQDPTGVQTLAEAAHSSIPENGNREALRRAGWKSGVSVDWATGTAASQNGFSSDAKIDQFGSTREAAAYQAKWEASYRHAFGDVTFGRVSGYDGSTFRYFYNVASGPFYSLFIAFRKSGYVFTWWGDGFSAPPVTLPMMQAIAEEQFLRIPSQ